MVKPITKQTLFMNCMELDFATKVELEHWMATFKEKVWTENVMKELLLTFEYGNGNGFKVCQKINWEKLMPKTQANYAIKARNNRGVIFYNYRG